MGVSRQTILNHRADVLKNIKKNPLPIKNFYNECDNKYVRALKILFDLKPYTKETKYMAAELLGVAYSTLTRYWSIALSEENITIRGVYGIFDQEKIIYIGSSENVRKRLK